MQISEGDQSRGFVIEDWPDDRSRIFAGRMFVVTGDWTDATESALLASGADGLVLGYTGGFRERSLEFLGRWPMRKLVLVARTIRDLSPIYRLGQTLDGLRLVPGAGATLDLGRLPHLTFLESDWEHIEDTIGSAERLRELIVWEFAERDLQCFSNNRALRELTLKFSPLLESLEGLAELGYLE